MATSHGALSATEILSVPFNVQYNKVIFYTDVSRWGILRACTVFTPPFLPGDIVDCHYYDQLEVESTQNSTSKNALDPHYLHSLGFNFNHLA